MSQIKAIYRRGVFEPLEPVNLADEQRVQLSVEPAGDQTVDAWLKQVRAIQAGIMRRSGPLPDSSGEIGQDRMR